MPRGFFTQTVCILLSRPAELAEIERLLGEYEISKRMDASDSTELSGPTLIIPYRPEVNGYVSIDLQGQPWPDHMGDPKAEPMLFAAWGMGHYGPYTYPGNLGRAVQQAWHWRDGAVAARERHQAFIRIRSTYFRQNLHIWNSDAGVPLLQMTLFLGEGCRAIHSNLRWAMWNVAV